MWQQPTAGNNIFATTYQIASV